MTTTINTSNTCTTPLAIKIYRNGNTLPAMFSNAKVVDLNKVPGYYVYNSYNYVTTTNNSYAYLFYNSKNIVSVTNFNKYTTNMANTFYGCYNLVNVSAIPNTVTNLCSTFSGCSNLVNAPSISSSAIDMQHTFASCTNLVNIPNIPNSVTNLYYTFYRCVNLIDAPVIPNGVTNMCYTFYNCSKLINAPVIPNSVSDLDRTFYNCVNLVNVPNIPNSVTIMTNTFSNCKSLVNAPIIPNSVINISRAFANCTNLVNVPNIPNSVTNMANTFANCINLVNPPIIHNGVINMDNSFRNCGNMTTAPAIPESVTAMNYAFANCTNLPFSNYPIIPNGVQHFTGMFASRRGYTDVPQICWNIWNNCSASVRTSMEGMFSGWWDLVNAPTIPTGVTSIAKAFEDCGFATAPVIPNSVTNMHETFSGCTKLVNPPVIPNSVTNMGFAFYLCHNLVTAPVIPDSVTDISWTFCTCVNLGDIQIYSNKITQASACFSGHPNSINVYIPFTYENGVNTQTYNAFIAAGYDTVGTRDGVYLKDINKPSGCCIEANTPINYYDGTIKLAKEVQVGDRLIGYDEANQEFVEVEVLQVRTPIRDSLVRLTLNDNSYIDMTPDHPLYTENGWQAYDVELAKENYKYDITSEITQLDFNSRLLYVDGTYKEIKFIEELAINDKIVVYTFDTTNGIDTYVSNGLVSHNHAI